MALRNAFENLATDRKLDNPMPVEMAGFFKRLFGIFGRFSFDGTSQLRTAVTGSVSISGTPTTNVTTMTTGNIGYGDSGKTSTIMQTSATMYGCAIRPNFTKA